MKNILDKAKTLHNWFDDPTFDISKVLTSIGVGVFLNSTQILWAHTVGALGGDPEKLDATPLSAKQKLEKAGLMDNGTWTIQYYFNKEDYNAINALMSNASVPVEVRLTDGSKFSNTGHIATNYVGEVGVNAVISASATIELSNPNGWTYTAAEG